MALCNTRDLSSVTQGILLDPKYLCEDSKVAGNGQTYSDTSLFYQWPAVSGSIFSCLSQQPPPLSMNPCFCQLSFPAPVPVSAIFIFWANPMEENREGSCFCTGFSFPLPHLYYQNRKC